MATHTENEKRESTVGQLHIPSTPLSDKPSSETLAVASHLSTDKGVDAPRRSDVSAPSTVHQANPFDTDIEAIITPSSERCGRKSTSHLNSNDCQMWPTNDHWRQKAKAAKRKRSCMCLAHLSKRNRILVKILIGLLIVGIAVGIGVGISKPLGAGIWQPHNQNGGNGGNQK
jgi:hypothetical protein